MHLILDGEKGVYHVNLVCAVTIDEKGRRHKKYETYQTDNEAAAAMQAARDRFFKRLDERAAGAAAVAIHTGTAFTRASSAPHAAVPSDGYPGMAAASIVVPGASSCVVETRFIRDRQTAQPIASLVENGRAGTNGPMPATTATNSQQRHDYGSNNKLTLRGHGSSSTQSNGNHKETDPIATPNPQRQQHDISTWLNYMTFLNGLDRSHIFLDLSLKWGYTSKRRQ